MATVLNSWKEIAAYVGRGVRTVQRWERELQFPVRRPRGRSRSAVIAIPRDIDAWLARTATGKSTAPSPKLSDGVRAIRLRTAILVREAERLQKCSVALQQELSRTMLLTEGSRNGRGKTTKMLA